MKYIPLLLLLSTLPLRAQQTPPTSPPEPEQPSAAQSPSPSSSPNQAPEVDAVGTPSSPLLHSDQLQPGLLNPDTTSGIQPQEIAPTIIQEATSEPATEQIPLPDLPPAELHLRKGIALLLQLHTIMAQVNTPETAAKAAHPIVSLTRELLKWSQAFASLPLLDEDARIIYEDQYIPVFEKINTQLKLQGERLNSAKFYGSRDLQAALIHLILTLQ